MTLKLKITAGLGLAPNEFLYDLALPVKFQIGRFD